MNAAMTCGEAAIALLERQGVDTVFGIPGVHTLDLYRGIGKSRLRHIGVRHEQGAGFMADGYARASGRPGVCVLITGPGVTNAATPIGQAFSDSVPVLLLSSVNETEHLGKGRGRLHEITDQHAVMAPLTGMSRTVRRPDELPAAIDAAFEYFATRRPRPVHIEIPLDVLAMPAPRANGKVATGTPPAPEDKAIKAAAAVIDGAKAPFLIAGGGTVDCAKAVVELAERIDADVAVTIAAKGVVPDNHPNSLGSTLVQGATQKLLAEADVVIAVGTELSETDSWIDRLPIRGMIVRIDIDPPTLVRDYPPAAAVLGDAGRSLAALAATVARRQPSNSRARARQEVRAANAADRPPLQAKHGRVLDAVRKAVPENGTFVTDMTQIAYTGNYHFPMSQPRRWFHPTGFGTLGYAMPAAIGAKLATPDRPTVAIAGDAGFLFTVQELATAVELNMPLAILLWNNDALGQIADDMVRLGIPEIGVKPRNPDYLAMARAFGANAVRAESTTALGEALQAAFKAGGPTLIEVRQDAKWLS
jgi:thiamine pyrophosphate-dependent acetolactate synthase large subunit-like protein